MVKSYLKKYGSPIGFLLGAGLLIVLGYHFMGFHFFPWFHKVEEVREYDLDQNGQVERYVLKDKQLRVTQEGQEIWRSSADWQVTAFVLADATNDGRDDLLLVVWKVGSFGGDKPFWVTEDDQELSNHLFVLNLIRGKMKPVWFSSTLDRPIQALEVKDINQDGKNELVVKEERNWLAGIRDRKAPTAEPAAESITWWQWKSWGFDRVDADSLRDGF
jgi:hypothetical protein